MLNQLFYFIQTTTQAPPLTADVDTVSPTTQSPTTQAPTTQAPTTQAPTTQAPTTVSPTTSSPTTQAPTTQSPTTQAPTTQSPTTLSPTTPRHSFTSNLELKTAIQEYLSQGCTTDEDCTARTLYGGAVSRLWQSAMVLCHICISNTTFLQFRSGNGMCPK